MKMTLMEIKQPMLVQCDCLKKQGWTPTTPLDENGDESKLLVTFYNGHGEILTDLQKRKVEVGTMYGGRGSQSKGMYVVLELEMCRPLLYLHPTYLGTQVQVLFCLFLYIQFETWKL